MTKTELEFFSAMTPAARLTWVQGSIESEHRNLKPAYIKMEPPGIYRLKLVYKDPFFPLPTEEELQRDFKAGKLTREELATAREKTRKHFGVVESNEVEIEVLP